MLMTVPNPAKALILLAEEGVLVEGETAPGNGGMAGDDSGVVGIAGDFEGDAIGTLLGAVVLDGGGDDTGEVAGEGVNEGVPVAAAGACGGGVGGTAAGAGGGAGVPSVVVVVITTFIPLSQCPCDPQMKYLFPEELRLITVIPPLYDPTELFVWQAS